MGTGADGRPIVTKVASAGVDAEALAEEAEVLVRAAHPGVVEVVRAERTPDGGFRLDTRLAGTRTLSAFRPAVDEAAGIVAALAATIADLHGVGIVHGAVEPAHVVLDPGGAPVLCGFGRGRRVGGSTPGDDVAGLGEVLAALVGEEAEVEPIPERRFGRRMSWSAAVARRSLLTLADQARADDRSARPSARAFAGAVLAAVPTARLRGATAATPRSSEPSEPVPPGSVPTNGGVGRLGRLVAAIAGLGLLAYGVSSVFGEVTAPAGLSGSTRSRPPASTATAATGSGDTLRLLECPAVTGAVADPDGDGCLSPVTIEPGVVEVDGVRYGVGLPGDALAVGDWDCDGSATVVAVRPATGEVFVFGGWAAPGDDLVVGVAARVVGADHAVAEDADGDGCPSLVVLTADGQRAEVAA
jgi:hypothetical protein